MRASSSEISRADCSQEELESFDLAVELIRTRHGIANRYAAANVAIWALGLDISDENGATVTDMDDRIDIVIGWLMGELEVDFKIQ